MKIVTFAVPCYNSSAYMKKCIETLLPGGEDVEIILINDGSSDDTGKIADEYASQYPGLVKAIHQENGGHGEGVNTGLKNASGMYYKVVDSDDWLDAPGMLKVIETLKQLINSGKNPDMMICNYVYEHAEDNTRHIVNYTNVLPENRIFTWEEVGSFKPSQYLLMHSVIYNTELLRKSGMVLPKHTFYVDNIFVFQPLPYVKTLYYMDIDLYRYFIGRSDQSVNEQVMIKRIDQQYRVTRIMIDSFSQLKLPDKKLDQYMLNYLSVMMAISSVLSVISGLKENLEKKAELWSYLKSKDEKLYIRLRYHLLGRISNLPGRAGRKLTVYLYRLLRRKYKFN
ncbi:glycosyltransferase family 2 protein [Oxobacter pfennigii]|nr:glycosyltransferase [Oxobacter pfennigii]